MSKDKGLEDRQFPPEVWQEAKEISSLPDDRKRSKEIAIRLMYARQSPYPPPHEVRVFQEYCPDFLERVVAMTERSLEHNIEIEKALLPANIDLAKRGMFNGGLIALLSMAALIFAIIFDSPWLGGGAIFTALSTIIVAFVTKQVKKH